jgi:hypothetical protein
MTDIVHERKGMCVSEVVVQKQTIVLDLVVPNSMYV